MDSELKIKSIAESKPSEEVCGFVLAKDGEVIVKECNNIAKDKKNYYQICPFDVLDAYKNHDKVLAVFHSHVSTDESPSEFDLEMSKHFDMDFWIYSLKTQKFYKHEKD